MLGIFVLLTLAHINIVWGCTEFIVGCKDEQKSILVGRTMEFAECPPCNIVSLPKHTKLVGDIAPSCNTPLSWQAKHKALYIIPDTEMIEDSHDIWVDGQNEAGLSVGALYLPGYASYPNDLPEANCSNAISHLQLLKFFLTHYATVQEVKSAIKDDTFPSVWGRSVKVDDGTGTPVDFVFPLHWSIVDRSGDAIVLEYTEKEGRRVFVNEVGVMTNSPTYDWHTTNLNNYINLQGPDFAPKPYTRNENTYTLKPFGQGSGMLGIPGDFTPPSRFIRTAAMVRFSGDASTAMEGALKAWHIINSVDITKGINDDKTCWEVVKDLDNNIMYYRDIDYLSLRKVELDRTSVTQSYSQVINGKYEDSVEDMTDKFQDPTKHEL